MNLSNCFICNKPIIDIDGQFQDFKIYSLDESEDAAIINSMKYGKCHNLCIKESEFRHFWYNKVFMLRKKQGYRSTHVNEDWILLVRHLDDDIIGMHKDGISVTFKLNEIKKGSKNQDGLQIKRKCELNIELDDVGIAETFRNRLRDEKKIALMEVFRILKLEDKTKDVKNIENSFLIFDKQLNRYCLDAWISGRCEYFLTIPTALVEKIKQHIPI